MRNGKVYSLLLVALLALATHGCSSIGGVGTNTFKFAYPEPDETGLVKLKYTPRVEAARATFQIRNRPADLPEGADALTDNNIDLQASGSLCADEEPGVFCVEMDVASLPANIYLVDVFLDDDTTPAGTLSFITNGFAVGDEAEE